MIFFKNGITVIDTRMEPGEARLLQYGIRDMIGLRVKNETGQHIFIEVKYYLGKPCELILRRKP